MVNLDTNAASQYDGYAFNSFFTRDGRQYGVGRRRHLPGRGRRRGRWTRPWWNWSVSTTNQPPQVRSKHYLGVASSGRMAVKVVADGAAHYWRGAIQFHRPENHRDTGRGLKGVNWSFTVLNQNGGDFDLAAIEFLPWSRNGESDGHQHRHHHRQCAGHGQRPTRAVQRPATTPAITASYGFASPNFTPVSYTIEAVEPDARRGECKPHL